MALERPVDVLCVQPALTLQIIQNVGDTSLDNGVHLATL
jgi:hypothetical protein